VLSTIGKSSARRGAWALLHSIGPLVRKLLNFEVYYELKNEKITFTFVLAVATA